MINDNVWKEEETKRLPAPQIISISIFLFKNIIGVRLENVKCLIT